MTSTTTIKTESILDGVCVGSTMAWVEERPHVWALGKTKQDAMVRLLAAIEREDEREGER
jgi:hypothetical protein